jgi:hypothetical protein
MRLLVSVRSAAEAAAALEGGAHIIDAKEPRHGSLGAVGSLALREIAGAVPADIPLSVALGDVATAAAVSRVLEALILDPRPGGTFVKLGFGGVTSEKAFGELLDVAVKASASVRCRPRLVAVAYADHTRAGVPSPATVIRIATGAGASALLLDTAIKDGKGLTSWMTPVALASWATQARQAGLLTALAGALAIDSLQPALAAGPDVIGVRGAACSGGRNGMVETGQVRALVAILANGRLAKRHVIPSMEPTTSPSST